MEGTSALLPSPPPPSCPPPPPPPASPRVCCSRLAPPLCWQVPPALWGTRGGGVGLGGQQGQELGSQPSLAGATEGPGLVGPRWEPVALGSRKHGACLSEGRAWPQPRAGPGGPWAGPRPAGGCPSDEPALSSPLLSRRAPDRHVQVKQRGSVLNMLRRLDRIRFRGHKRDDFLDLAESPNASDTECGDEIPLKIPRTSPRDSEELRDPVSTPRGPPGAGAPRCARPRTPGPSLGRGLPHPWVAQLDVDWGRPRPSQAGQTQMGLTPALPQSPNLTGGAPSPVWGCLVQ